MAHLGKIGSALGKKWFNNGKNEHMLLTVPWLCKAEGQTEKVTKKVCFGTTMEISINNLGLINN